MANQLMKIGGIGGLITAAGLIVTFIVSLMVLSALAGITTIAGVTSALEAMFLWTLIAGILLSAGVILSGLGMFGLSKQFNDQLSMIAGIIAIIGAVIAVIPYISFVGAIIMGVGILLMGIPFITLKTKLGLGSLGTATGVLLIITGAMLASILGALFAIFVGVPAFILLAVVFFKIK